MSISDNLLTENLFGGNFDLTTDIPNNNSNSFFNNNSIIYIIIFILFVIVFYFIINKFGYSNYNLENTSQESNIKSLQNNISQLQSELSNIKSEMSSGETKNSNSDPIINFTTGSDPNMNLGSGSCASGSCPKPPPIIFDPIANYDQAKLFDPLVDPRGRPSADQIPAPQVAAQFNFPTQGVLDRYHRVGLLIGLDSAPDSSPRKHRGKKSKRINKKGRYPNDDVISLRSANTFASDNSTDSTDSSNSTGSYRGVQIAPVRAEKGIGGISGIEGFGIYADEGPNGILELIGKKINDNWYQYFTSISKGNKVIKIVVNNRNRKELYSGDVVYLPELNRWYQVQMDSMDMIEYNPYLF
jgi:hypothetical protein